MCVCVCVCVCMSRVRLDITVHIYSSTPVGRRRGLPIDGGGGEDGAESVKWTRQFVLPIIRG